MSGGRGGGRGGLVRFRGVDLSQKTDQTKR